tara:strand:+ start:116 stop:367 length:252 start_codon:yes stop_codon:yes gene_type:complete
MELINTSRETTREPKNNNNKNQEEAHLESMLRLFIRWVEGAETEEDLQGSLDAMKQLVKLRRKDELSLEARFVMRSAVDGGVR